MGVKLKEHPKGKGVWWIFINHNKRRKSFRVGQSKAAAETLQAKIILRLREGDLGVLSEKPKAEALTLRQYAATWLKDITGTLKASTLEFYAQQMTLHILPALGDQPLTALSKRDFRQLIATLRSEKKLKTKTITGIVGTARACLTCAVDDELIQTNPAFTMRSALKRPKDETKREPKPFDVVESDRLLSVAREEFPEWTAFLMFALRTGARPAEIFGLQWDDIDFPAKAVTIQRGIVNGKHLTNTPKNGKARTVDLSQQMTTELESWRRSQREKYFAAGKPLPVWVFPNGAGNHLDESIVRKHFQRIVKRADLGTDRVLYDCRHGFASQLLADGAPITAVSKAMGHSNSAITLSVYAKWLPTADRREVDRLDDASRRIPRASQQAVSGDFPPHSAQTGKSIIS